MTRTRTTIALVTMVAAVATTVAQNSADERIRRIENGLIPPVVLKGQPIPTSKLEDRMRELKIPGVSIAVFENGRIECAYYFAGMDLLFGQQAENGLPSLPALSVGESTRKSL